MNLLTEFLAHWAITAASLWICSWLFHGIRFDNTRALLISALLLGFANAVIRPIVIVLTIPLTVVSFGFFLLVINALMILLVSSIIRGFKVSGFWTAFFAAIFIAVFSFLAGMAISQGGDEPIVIPRQGNELLI